MRSRTRKFTAVVGAMVALSGIGAGAPAVARASDCIGCTDGAYVDLTVSARLVPHHNGWSAVEFTVKPHFPLLDPLPRYVPPTSVRIDFGGGHRPWIFRSWAADGYAGTGVAEYPIPSLSSTGYPYSFVVYQEYWGGWPEYPGSYVTVSATVDANNEVAEFSEWNNDTSIIVPEWRFVVAELAIEPLPIYAGR